MPNPAQEYAIGSGPAALSDIAAQRFQWAQANNAVENANLARAAEAMNAQNRWNSEAAQLDQANANRFESAAERGATRDAQARRDAESAREFGVTTELHKGQQAIENKRWDFGLAERNRQEAKTLAEAADLAESKAPEVQRAGSAADKAEAAYNQALVHHNQAVASATSGITLPTVFNRYTGLYTWGKLPLGVTTIPKDQQAKLDKANEDISAARDTLASADVNNRQAQATFSNLHGDLRNYPWLTIVKDSDGKYGVRSVAHKRTWFGKNGADDPLPAQPPPVAVDDSRKSGRRPTFGIDAQGKPVPLSPGPSPYASAPHEEPGAPSEPGMPPMDFNVPNPPAVPVARGPNDRFIKWNPFAQQQFVPTSVAPNRFSNPMPQPVVDRAPNPVELAALNSGRFGADSGPDALSGALLPGVGMTIGRFASAAPSSEPTAAPAAVSVPPNTGWITTVDGSHVRGYAAKQYLEGKLADGGWIVDDEGGIKRGEAAKPWIIQKLQSLSF